MTGLQPVRVFVGLKLTPQIAQELAALARPLERHGARVVSSADIHLTLVPPWNETRITEAIETLRSAFPRFLLSFIHELTTCGRFSLTSRWHVFQEGDGSSPDKTRWIRCSRRRNALFRSSFSSRGRESKTNIRFSPRYRLEPRNVANSLWTVGGNPADVHGSRHSPPHAGLYS
jgi:hypothetical protein